MKVFKSLVILWLCGAITALLLSACGSSDVPTTAPVATTGVTTQNVTTAPATNAGLTLPTLNSGSTTTAPATLAATTAAPTTAATTAVTTTTAAATSVAATTTAPTVATTTSAATTQGAPSATTAALTRASGSIANAIYSKKDGLYAYNLGTAKSFALAQGQIFRYVVSPDNRRVAFLSVSGNKLVLNMVTLHGNSVSDPVVMDGNVGIYTPSTDDNPYAGNYMRAYTLDFSPDNNLVVYSKMNSGGPTFDFWGTSIRPIELWLAEVQTYNVHRLAPNTAKDVMYKAAFSPDGARVGFLRTANFPSDVSGSAAVWSVHTDGTVLTVLQDGATLSKQAHPATGSSDPVVGQINSFSWTGPMALTFFVSDLRGGTAWVHDLSTAHARQLFDLSYGGNNSNLIQDYRYDGLSHRYAFNTDKGLFTIGTASPQDKAVPLTAKLSRLLNFYDSSVLYVNDANTVVVQSVNNNGSPAGVALGLASPYKSNGTVHEAQPANGDWLVVWSDDSASPSLNLSVISGDGKSVLGQAIQGSETGNIMRLAPDYFLLTNTDRQQLLDLSNASNPRVIGL